MKFMPTEMPSDNDADDQGAPRRMAPPMSTRRGHTPSSKKGGGLGGLRRLLMMAPRRGMTATNAH